MALIKCPECGKMISDQASNCPECGYPVSKNKECAVEKTFSVFCIFNYLFHLRIVCRGFGV